MIDFEELQSLRENYEQRKREEQERKDTMKMEYQRMVSACKNEADDRSIHTAQALREAVRKEEYGSVLTILDKAIVPDRHTFEIEICPSGPDSDSIGDWSRLFIQMPDGNRSESVFEFLRFEDTCMGGWQAFLLHQLWHYLPLWWHGNYEKRRYLYSAEDEPPFEKPLPYFAKKVWISPDFSQLDLAPEIRSHEGKYYISACFWTSFGGLIREYISLTLNEGRMTSFFPFYSKTLVEYDCGIVF